MEEEQRRRKGSVNKNRDSREIGERRENKQRNESEEEEKKGV